jgi:hypothetical protein
MPKGDRQSKRSVSGASASVALRPRVDLYETSVQYACIGVVAMFIAFHLTGKQDSDNPIDPKEYETHARSLFISCSSIVVVAFISVVHVLGSPLDNTKVFDSTQYSFMFCYWTLLEVIGGWLVLGAGPAASAILYTLIMGVFGVLSWLNAIYAGVCLLGNAWKTLINV